MEKVMFLELECVYFYKYCNDLVNKDFNIFEHSGTNFEFVKLEKNGGFKFRTEDELAIQFLREGKGVSYKGQIMFKEQVTMPSIYYSKFTEFYYSKLGEFKSYMGGVVYENIKDAFTFSLVRSIITLYNQNLFTEKVFVSKLQKYLKEEGISDVLDAVNNVRMVG